MGNIIYDLFTPFSISFFILFSFVDGCFLFEMDMALPTVVKSKEKHKVPEFMDGETVSSEWTIESKLGEGGFGAVYKVFNKDKKYFAMKVEDDKAPVRILKMDVIVLCDVSRKKAKHFCRVIDTGNVRGVNYLVMTLVGQSLADLRKMTESKKFSIGCVLLAGIQCIEAIEELHSCGYLHRDIKGGNFTIGRNEPKRIYMIDFGMCRRFLDKNSEVRKPRWACGFRGTLQYASVSCHIQREQCRKDDLESWMYSQVEWTNGQLPWKKLSDMDEIAKMKMAVRKDKVKDYFSSCPRIYIDVLNYLDTLCYYDVPDYQKMIADFKTVIIANNLQNSVYDWENF